MTVTTEVVPTATEVPDPTTTTIEAIVEPETTTESIPSPSVSEETDVITTTTQVIVDAETTTETIPDPLVPEETDVIPTTTQNTVDAETTTESIPSTAVPVETDATTEARPTPETVAQGNGTAAEVVKDKLSEQIRKILRHYQRPDPEGFPGAPIPDPLSIPPMKKNFGLADMTFTNMTVHGLSKFQVDRVNMDLKNMQVRMA